jgi:hypothetical protein
MHLTVCQLSRDLPKVRTFNSHFLKDARKLFPWDACFKHLSKNGCRKSGRLTDTDLNDTLLFYFLLWPLHFHVTCKGGHCLSTPKGLYLWFKGVDLKSFRSNRTTHVSNGTFVGPSCTVITTYHYMFVDIRNKNIDGLWVDISNVFKI